MAASGATLCVRNEHPSQHNILYRSDDVCGRTLAQIANGSRRGGYVDSGDRLRSRLTVDG